MIPLQEAIKQVLLNFGALSYEELAHKVNEHKLYLRKDGALVPASQIAARVKKHSELFKLTAEGRVQLKSLGLSKLKWGMDIIGNLLYTQGGAQYLQELLLPTFAIYLKYGVHDWIQSFAEKDSVAKLVKGLNALNKSKRFAGLFTQSISMYERLEEHLKKDICEVLQLSINGGLQTIQLTEQPKVSALDSDDAAVILENDWYSVRKIEEDEFIGYFNKLINEFIWKRSIKQKLGSTPEALIELMASFCPLTDGDVLFDPFAGKSSLLTALVRQSGCKNIQIVAGDTDEFAVLLSRMNFAVNNIPASSMQLKNAFTDWSGAAAFADWFISNPPFFSKIPAPLIPNGPYGNSADGSAVLIKMALFHLKEKGKACLLLPDAFTGAVSKGLLEVKRHLVEHNFLEGVISLPSGLFAPYSGIKTCLLLLDKGRAEKKRTTVFFYDASRTKAIDFPNAVKEIAAAYHDESLSSGESFSRVPLETIVARGFTLAVHKLLHAGPSFVSGNDYQPVFNLLPQSSSGGVYGIYKGTAVPKALLSDKAGIPYLQIADLKNTASDYLLTEKGVHKFVADISDIYPLFIEPGTVLIAKNGDLLKPTLYTGTEKAICSHNIIALQLDKTKMLPEYFILQLHKKYVQEQLALIRRGVTIPYLRIEDFLGVQVLVPELLEQAEVVEQNRQAFLGAEQQQKEATLLIGELMHKANGPLGSISAAVERLEKYLLRKEVAQQAISFDDIAYKLLPGEQPEQFPQYSVGETLKRVQVNIKRIQEYMSRTLLFAELNRSEPQLEPINLYALLAREVIPNNEYKVRVAISSRSDVDRNILVNADKNLLLAVFDNLVDNAYIHGFSCTPKANDHVHILWEIRKSSKEDRALFITVENNGLPARGLTREKFISEGHTTNGKGGGMGIGGAFIHKALEQMGGGLVDVLDVSGKVGAYTLQFILKLNLHE